MAWIDGHVTPAAFEPAAVRDPRYRSVMALTRIVSSPEVAQHEAFVEAAFADGAVERLHVAHARGTPARPLTDGDLLEKFVAALTLGGIAGGEQLGTMILSEPRVPIATLMDRAEPSRRRDVDRRHAGLREGLALVDEQRHSIRTSR